jgi:ABC-type molybdate transport system substrate-binding protein
VRSIRVLPALVLTLALALAGCAEKRAEYPSNGSADGAGTEGVGNPDTSMAPQALSTIRVFASDSLTEPFDLIREDFQARNPSVELVHTYAQKESLTRQIAGGEPADVLVTENGGRLEIEALSDEPDVALFVEYLREGNAQRILSDAGVSRP